MPRWVRQILLPLTFLLPYSAVHGADLSTLVGTIGVQFQSVQAGGKRQGCSLVFSVVGQDQAYRRGAFVALVGNITFWANQDQTAAVVSFKLGTSMAPHADAEAEAPYFAYLQTPHGTTATSKFLQYEAPDTPGTRIFAYALDDKVLSVLKDIVDGAQVTIGFNRTKDGLDVLVPLDLSVAETTPSGTGFSRRHSKEMVSQFASCNAEVAKQIARQPNRK
ncbi:MAG: hypothetical protein H8K04_14885 [Nitrospira sp.]